MTEEEKRKKMDKLRQSQSFGRLVSCILNANSQCKCQRKLSVMPVTSCLRAPISNLSVSVMQGWIVPMVLTTFSETAALPPAKLSPQNRMQVEVQFRTLILKSTSVQYPSYVYLSRFNLSLVIIHHVLSWSMDGEDVTPCRQNLWKARVRAYCLW